MWILRSLRITPGKRKKGEVVLQHQGRWKCVLENSRKMCKGRERRRARTSSKKLSDGQNPAVINRK